MFHWLPLLISPFIGSFLANAVIENQSIVRMLRLRSACDHCQTPLSIVDLTPVFGWFINRGSCRHCKAKIYFAYPIVEISAIIVAAWTLMVMPPGWLQWASCGLGWALLVLATIDFRELRLPDAINLPLIPLGLVFTWLIDFEFVIVNIISAVVAAAVLLTLRFLFDRMLGRESLGLGDVKLVAAAAAWLGPFGVTSTLTYGAITGLCFGLWQRRREGEKAQVPFGTFLCLGFWLTWLYGPLLF